ncbi:FecR family protein [Sphingosinithalassobacter portus]|uniref:FecR family protein n=1 Tax=Stakelama portus TaxID=2676234 RepID=UPI000D6E8C62|nr:FecR domain-containing protein [Sphingosinithalassobacter portus]
MAHDARIEEQAAAWAVRTGDPAFEDWEGFTAWLERDPAHARAYDRVASGVADAVASEPPVRITDTDEVATPARHASTRRWFVGGAIAASLAIAGIGFWQSSDGGYAIETASGETRTIPLTDGGQIVLAGDSRVALNHDDPRSATLDRGQALFVIRHDDTKPFRVTVGDAHLVDLGTVFDVTNGDGGLRVAVAEGAVAYNPQKDNVRLDPGDVLTTRAGSPGYAVSQVPADQVGEWREGRLTFRDARLRDVAADLSRMTGIAFTVSTSAADKRISGSVRTADIREDPEMLGALLGIALTRTGDTWVIG